MQGKSFNPSIAVMGRDNVGRSKSSLCAVKQAETLGFKRVIFEGDAWNLGELLRNKGFSPYW